MDHPQELFSKGRGLTIEFNLNSDEKLKLREINNVNLGSVIMGDVAIIQKLLPNIANANVMRDKGKSEVSSSKKVYRTFGSE